MKTATKTLPKVGDRILYLGRIQGTIAAIKKGMLKYEIAWDSGRSEHYSQREWNRGDFELCGNSTSAQVLALASHSQQLSLESLSSSDCVSAMSGVSQSSPCDTQTSPSTQTLEGLQLVLPAPEFNSLQPVPLANPSRSKANAKEQTTNATVSPPCVKRSLITNPPTSASKTFRAYSLAPTNQEKAGIPILSFSSMHSMPAGTMSNGLLYQAVSLVEPLKEPDCFWLESPGGLSSDASRSPGQSRLEAQLKKVGRLNSGECINPPFLEKSFEIPVGYSSPSESKTAVQLLADAEKPSEIVLTPELPPLLLEECNISTRSQSEGKILGEIHTEITHKSPRKRSLPAKRSPNLKPASGSLSACTTIKKGKPYVSYQYSYDVRDTNSKRGWRTVKVGVPKFKRQAIANFINEGKPIAEILEALKR